MNTEPLPEINHIDTANTRRKRIKRDTNIVLILLWVGTATLLSLMVFKWVSSTADTSGIWSLSPGNRLYIDDILLSSSDVERNRSNSLINITLNQAPVPADTTDEKSRAYAQDKKNTIYNNILKRKIKNAKKETNNGFSVRPLPNPSS